MFILLFTCRAICTFWLFCGVLPRFGNIGYSNVCLLSNIMELDGTQLRTMTRLLKIIHRPCCEQFHVGTIFFLPNYTYLAVITAQKEACTCTETLVVERRQTPLCRISPKLCNLSRWMNSPRGKRMSMHFWFWAESFSLLLRYKMAYWKVYNLTCMIWSPSFIPCS